MIAVPIPTKPMADGTEPSNDRRACRAKVLPCERCGADRIRVLTRTDWVIYVRCEACFDMWSIEKPRPTDDQS
jgi:hypothetical protein